jgi:CheY-like chemotaxis protein
VSERPYQKGESLRIAFSLPDGTTVEKGKIVVRNVTDTAEGACLGCQFDFEDETLSDDIEFFVATTLERIRGKTSAVPRILIFEKEPDAVLALQNTLLKEGYEVVVSGDLVDGFFLLRMTVPDVLLIRAGLVDPSGVQVCKMVKAKSRFRNMPVIVFGENAPSIGDQAKEAGAAGYLPTIQNTGAVLEALAEHVTPPSGDDSDENEAAS